MGSLKSKYKRGQSELVDTLLENGRTTVVLEINVLTTSKIKEHLIYECIYLHNSRLKTTQIIARDITDAMSRLEPFIKSGASSSVINYVLNNENII